MRLHELMEAVGDFYTTTYHGTGIENVKTAVVDGQGLKMNTPRTTAGWGQHAVYLTPNISLAARYAMGGLSTAPLNRTPAILEIKLIGSRRHKTSMREDPLDRDDNAWRNHYDSGESEDQESMREIENDVKEFLEWMAKKYQFTVPPYISIDLGREVGGLQGYPIHQYVKSLVAKFAGEKFAAIKNDVSRYLNSGSLAPGGTFADGHIQVSPSGTFVLSPEYWASRHQNYYTRNIPVAAIKAVWVRESDFPAAAGSKQTFGMELLPSEVVDKFEAEKHKLDNLGDEVSRLVDEFLKYPDEKENIASELEEIEKGLGEYEDLQDMVSQVLNGLDDEEFDFDDVVDKITDRAREMEGYLADDYMPGTAVEINKDTVWIRVDTKNVKSLF